MKIPLKMLVRLQTDFVWRNIKILNYLLTLTFSKQRLEKYIHGSSRKSGISELRMFHVIYFISMRSQERYSSPLKIGISPVVLHIISFHGS